MEGEGERDIFMEAMLNPTVAVLDSFSGMENFPSVYEELLALGYRWIKDSIENKENLRERDMYPLGLEYYLLKITHSDERYNSLRAAGDPGVPGAPSGVEAIVEHLEDAYVSLA